MPLPITTLPVQGAARTSDGWAYVIRSAFLNPLGVPFQSPIRQIARAADGSPDAGIVIVLRAVVAPAATVTWVLWTASSPL